MLMPIMVEEHYHADNNFHIDLSQSRVIHSEFNTFLDCLDQVFFTMISADLAHNQDRLGH